MIVNCQNGVIVEKSDKREVHKAGWVVIDSSLIIENGFLEIENGIIKDFGKKTAHEKIIDHGPGVIMPPVVNTHLHLELSALKNCLPFDRGFDVWVKKLLKKRQALGKEKLIQAAGKAVLGLKQSGNLYVGDISTLGIIKPLLENSGLYGISFSEFLGSDIASCFLQKNDLLSFSAAGHGPHTCSPQLLLALKKNSKQHMLPFSIHVAESDLESQFIHDRKGEWADFLTLRNIDWSSWETGSKTPVSYINDIGLLDPFTIAVHALNVSDDDIQMLAQSKAKVCVCPRSNQNLHGKIPDIEKMIQHGIRPALGTDSLASCDSLNIFDEMAFVKDNYPGLDPEAIFEMATINGAKALGLEQFTGTLSKGRTAHFLYRQVNAKNKKQVFQEIVSNE